MKTYEMSYAGRGYKISAEPSSRVGGKLATGVPYEHRLLHHIHRQHYRGTAVDVGAHIGNHALFLAAVCELAVVAFEPLHEDHLVANIELNPGVRVKSKRTALGARAGWARPIGKDRQLAPSGGWNLVELETCEEGAEGALEVRTLDEYELRDVCLVKVDVEGMEVDVLRGAWRTLQRWTPDIYAEARDAESGGEISDVLAALGYRLREMIPTATPVGWWSV